MMSTIYENCIVLYSAANCAYCIMLKSMQYEWLTRVVHHDVLSQGWPLSGCALPELWVYGREGRVLAKLSGAKRTPNEYETFMLKWRKYATHNVNTAAN